MITSIDHLGLAIRDRRKAIEFFENSNKYSTTTLA